ncbi:MAG: DUF305 domain-containing protein [Thermoleophilia bacterium]|nr:DUF305 domain-containing protein [Thermoleophilia bacterium]
MNPRAIALAAVLALVALLVVAGCGGESSDSGASSGSGAVPFDQAFIDAMVPHHEQAIEMATDAKAAGLSEPALVEIADAVIATQQQEIDKMKGWREEWFGSGTIDPAGADALGMSMDEMGMSDTRMDFGVEDDVDAAFASMMADHHQGAIDMAELAGEKAEHAEVADLARAIIVAQQGEIDILHQFAGGGHDMGDMGS